jgi:ribosomal protein S18 acetylase RimI-like enzyme
MLPVTFLPVDLERDADVCVLFRRDAHVCSFGHGDAFATMADGATGYLQGLRERLASLPAGIVHVWRDARIIGQIEARIPAGASGGYISLFYLVPEERGAGAGDALHEYAVSLFRRHQLAEARLSVSPTNPRAVRYYQKHGWRDLGPRPGAEPVHLMELEIPP